MDFFNPFIFQFFQQEPEIKLGQHQFFSHLIIWSIAKPTFDGYVIPDQSPNADAFMKEQCSGAMFQAYIVLETNMFAYFLDLFPLIICWCFTFLPWPPSLF